MPTPAPSPWPAWLGGQCIVCRGWCARGLCPSCAAAFAAPCLRCRRCGRPLALPDTATGIVAATGCGPACPQRGAPWSALVAGFDYGWPWDRLIPAWKFHARLASTRGLLQPLLPAAAAEATASGPRLLLPVPVSTERLRERGYNQAWELARRLGRGLGLPARADALLRLRDTGHQLGLARTDRQHNLRNAFFVARPAQPALRGARVALVDDVFTTGATAAAACDTLRAAGVADVQVWVLARTPAAGTIG